MKNVLAALLFLLHLHLFATRKDTVLLQEIVPKIRVITYERFIFNSKGFSRTDQNFIGNFKLFDWIKLEAGVRFGERPQLLNSYYQYKLELQSKWFYKTFRFFARLSDNINNYPPPAYQRTIGVFAAEVKYSFLKRFKVLGGFGYVFSAENSKPDFLPTTKGTINNYPIYRVIVKYSAKKTDIDLMYGTYDVFNPDIYYKAFLQVFAAYEISKKCKIQGYIRYKYDKNFVIPLNYYFSLGVMFNIS